MSSKERRHTIALNQAPLLSFLTKTTIPVSVPMVPAEKQQNICPDCREHQMIRKDGNLVCPKCGGR